MLDSKTVQQHAANNDWGNRWLTTNEAGSGPFMLETWQAKDVLRMQRNPHYWRDEPKMSRVVLRHFQESQTLRLMIEKGDLDIANNMAVADINALRKDPQLTVEAVQKGTVYYVAMSMKEAHFANAKVREAVRYLIDYQGINKALMPGYGVLHQRPIKAGMPSTLPDPGYKLDIPRAKNCWQRRVTRTDSIPPCACWRISRSSILPSPCSPPDAGGDQRQNHHRHRQPDLRCHARA